MLNMQRRARMKLNKKMDVSTYLDTKEIILKTLLKYDWHDRALHMSQLNIHRRHKSGEKPFSCNFCDKVFSLKGFLSSHMKTHAVGKPFKGIFCCKTIL